MLSFAEVLIPISSHGIQTTLLLIHLRWITSDGAPSVSGFSRQGLSYINHTSGRRRMLMHLLMYRVWWTTLPRRGGCLLRYASSSWRVRLNIIGESKTVHLQNTILLATCSIPANNMLPFSKWQWHIHITSKEFSKSLRYIPDCIQSLQDALSENAHFFRLNDQYKICINLLTAFVILTIHHFHEEKSL